MIRSFRDFAIMLNIFFDAALFQMILCRKSEMSSIIFPHLFPYKTLLSSFKFISTYMQLCRVMIRTQELLITRLLRADHVGRRSRPIDSGIVHVVPY